MNRRSTALIFILSLLALHVANSMAQGEPAPQDPAAPAPSPVTTDASPNGDSKEDPKEVPDASGGAAVTEGAAEGGEGSTVSGVTTFTAVGAIATAMLANFF